MEAQKLNQELCPRCESEMLIGRCTNMKCGATFNADIYDIPVSSIEQATMNMYRIGRLRAKVDTVEKQRAIELEMVNAHYDARLVGPNNQLDFFSAPVENYLRLQVEADPKASKSLKTSDGVAKLSKAGGNIVLSDDFKPENYQDKIWVAKVLTFKVSKSELKKEIQETGEIYEGVEIAEEKYNFSIKPVMKGGDDE